MDGRGRRMTDAEVMELLRGTLPINRARQEFSSAAARIENQLVQGLNPIEMRRQEFEAVEKIAFALFGEGWQIRTERVDP